MKKLLKVLLGLFKSETTNLPPGETELDYVPISEFTIKKRRKPKEKVVFHPEIKVKSNLKVKN